MGAVPDYPVTTWIFDQGDDPARGADLLRRSLNSLAVHRMTHDISLSDGERPQTSREREHAALTGAGVDEVIAGTDTGNVPMAEAFARAGYAEEGRVFRYYWRPA